MAGPNPDSFERALRNFRRSLSPEAAHDFSICSLQDVQTVCMEIQQEQGKMGCLRRMKRIEGFIEAMDQLGKTIDVFLNANEFVCFVWGPIKFLLGAAKTHLESFDKLLDAYAQVGAAIPGLMVYRSTFEKHPPLAAVLEDYYSDILRFHEAALAVFNRRKWKEFFRSAWKTFDTQFQPILQSLERRRELVESEKGSASLYEISRVREQIQDLQEESRQRISHERLESHNRRLSYIRDRLQAPDYYLDQEMAAEDRSGSSSGSWVFKHPSFQEWACKTTKGHGVLYVNGIPGAGKSTLMSAVIERLLDENCARDGQCDSLVAYFYFKHKQLGKDTHNSLLRAIMEQLVARDPILCDHIYGRLGSVEGVNLRSTKSLEPLITKSIGGYRTSYIVLDGLDEAMPGEAVKSVEWLLSLLNGRLTDNANSTRVLFCGQRDGVLDTLLSDQPSISLEHFPDHDDDIRSYCTRICSQIRKKFDLSSDMESDIVSRVTIQANGMFLYARVVLDNLLSQTKLSRLRQELDPGTFPKGIDKAYERVAMSIFEESPIAEREDATKVLGWLTCAQRLLRWREIQSLFCIELEDCTVDYEGNRLRVSCKQLCGSLVDVHRGETHSEDIIKIVHETAREYLLHRHWIDTSLEHAKAASFCFRYLTTAPFLCGSDNDALLSHAKQGCYALQDYAVQYSWDHFEAYLATYPDEETTVYQETMESTGVFLKSYSLSAKFQTSKATPPNDEILCFTNELPKERREKAGRFNLGYRTLNIRNQIEAMQRAAITEDVGIVKDLYGPHVVYKCPKPWCGRFSRGFEAEKDRTQHVNRHDRPFRCPEDGCPRSQLGFADKSQLERHKKTQHADDMALFPMMTTGEHENDIRDAAAKGDLSRVSAILFGNPFLASVTTGRRLSTPLSLAAKNGHYEVCKLLLETHNDEIKSAKGVTPALESAAGAARLDICHLLLNSTEAQVSRDQEIINAMGSASRGGRLEALKFLVETVIGSYESFSSFLFKHLTPYINQASRRGRFGVIEYLLQRGFAEYIEPSALTLAEKHGHEDVAGLLRPILAARDQLMQQLQLQQQQQQQMHQHQAMQQGMMPKGFRDTQGPGTTSSSSSSVPPASAPQDYQMQLMLLEQQNKKRIIMERQAGPSESTN